MKATDLLLAIFSILYPLVNYTQSIPTFEIHVIDTIGTHLAQTDLADLDNDGDLDWIAGEAPWGKSRLWWWEYQGADQWLRHPIGQANSDVGGACYDINQDGWMDFWGGSMMFLNNHDKTFSAHAVNTIFSHDSQFGDINGDGRADGISNSDKYGLVWYDIPEQATEKWTEHIIQPIIKHKIHAGTSPQPVGDLDLDGDQDVVTAQAWYENVDGSGTQWIEHKVLDLGEEHKYGIGVKTWVIDLDRDGDEDIVQSEADNPDSRVAWFDNDGTGSFTRHMIKEKGEQQDFHSLILADFDLDGDHDIFSGGGPLSGQEHKLYIWENQGKIAGKLQWKEHIVGELPCHEAIGGDVDGDGDIDVCTKPWTTGKVHYFLENKLIDQNNAREIAQKMLDEQAAYWNNGNIDQFMKTYWNSDELLFLSKAGYTKGWQETLNNYHRRYPDRQSMGELTFTLDEVHQRSPTIISLIGQYHLERQELDNLDGYFMLILQQFDDQWLIVADSTH